MSEVCIESVTSQFHKMLELPVILSGPPEDRDVANRRLNLGEVLAVLSDECDDALNGRQPHVLQDYVAAHGAQFPAHSKVGQREIEQMTSVHENNVKRSAWSAR
jgi:hypothetical protein